MLSKYVLLLAIFLLLLIMVSLLNWIFFPTLVYYNSVISEMMAQRDPAAAAAQRYKPIQSAVPGTTLGPIQIDAFLGGGVYAILICVFSHHKCSFLFNYLSFIWKNFFFSSVVLHSCSSES